MYNVVVIIVLRIVGTFWAHGLLAFGLRYCSGTGRVHGNMSVTYKCACDFIEYLDGVCSLCAAAALEIVVRATQKHGVV